MATPAQTRKRYTKGQSLEWYRGLARSAYGIRREMLKGDDGKRYRNSVAIGRMYAFFYDAKHKDKLPVWDRFPLIFPIEFYQDGFLGLNLHYLSVGQRDQLIGILMRYANNQSMDETTRLMLSWKAVTATSRMKGLSEKCVKRYLRSQVRSRFIEVHANEWDKVITLPVEEFEYKR
jgi:hypothetical protein